MKLYEIAKALRAKIEGDGDVEISGVAALEAADEGKISFISNRKYAAMVPACRASALIVPPGTDTGKIPHIASHNPALSFAEVVGLFHPKPAPKGVSPMAVVEKNVNLGRKVTVYPMAYIGEGATLGDGVTVYPGVYIGAGSMIGDDCIIYPNAVIMDRTRMGNRVIIHGGTVIGGDGYGFVWDGKQHRKMPQVGEVIIGDDVEIGANCTIDRATLGRTEIKKGTKIDDQVHIAHNCSIGENTLLVGQVGLSGSVEVGANVVIAGQTGVAGHLKIGNGAVIGGRSGVTKDIESGAKVTGYPPLPHMEWMKVQKTAEKLPEMRKLLKELSKKIEKLEAIDD